MQSWKTAWMTTFSVFRNQSSIEKTFSSVWYVFSVAILVLTAQSFANACHVAILVRQIEINCIERPQICAQVPEARAFASYSTARERRGFSESR
jgi:hypothetical protein